jgi:hypothetical protein
MLEPPRLRCAAHERECNLDGRIDGGGVCVCVRVCVCVCDAEGEGGTSTNRMTCELRHHRINVNKLLPHNLFHLLPKLLLAQHALIEGHSHAGTRRH